MNGLEFSAIALMLLCVVAAYFDWSQFRIPNKFNLFLVVSGILFNTVVSGWNGLGLSLAGVLIGFLLLLGPFAMGGIGGGDVKLLAGAGAWLGPPLLLVVFLISSILLGVVSAYKLFESSRTRQAAWRNLKSMGHQLYWARELLGGIDRVEEVAKREDRSKRLVPYAVIFAVSLFCLVLWNWLGDLGVDWIPRVSGNTER